MRIPLILLLLILLGSALNCGIKDGPKKEYYKTGELLSEGSMKNFRYEGPYKEYYQDGKLKLEANFHRGKLEGIAKAYDENGNMILKEVYKNGEIVYRNEYK